MLRKKFKSLVVPYVIWSVFGLIVCMAGSLTASSDDVFAFSSRTIYPLGNRALWYVRALMIFMAIGVFVRVCMKLLRLNNSWLFAVLFFAVVKVVLAHGIAIGPQGSYVFFVLGIVASKWMLSQEDLRIAFNQRWLGPLSVGIAILIRAYWFRLGHCYTSGGDSLIANASVAFLIVGLWFWVDMLPKRIREARTLAEVASVAPFVYFMHYPCLDLAKHFLRWADREVLFVVLAVVSPVVLFFFAVAIKRYVRPLYDIMSGGR